MITDLAYLYLLLNTPSLMTMPSSLFQFWHFFFFCYLHLKCHSLFQCVTFTIVKIEWTSCHNLIIYALLNQNFNPILIIKCFKGYFICTVLQSTNVISILCKQCEASFGEDLSILLLWYDIQTEIHVNLNIQLNLFYQMKF